MIKSFSFLLAAVVAAAVAPAARADVERRLSGAAAQTLPAAPVKSLACTTPASRIAALFTAPTLVAAASSCDHCDAHRDRAFDRCMNGRVPECVDGGGISETCCVDHAWDAWWICCYP